MLKEKETSAVLAVLSAQMNSLCCILVLFPSPCVALSCPAHFAGVGGKLPKVLSESSTL